MFWKESKVDLLLQDEIEHGLKTLKTHKVGSEDYNRILETVIRMQAMQTKSSVSKDTLAIISANLLGIFMIIKHENVNVITSRAMNLVMKPR
jgi:hypothetical protein